MTRSRHIPDRSASTAEREALSESARLALAHIHARTRQGKFASGLYWMPASEWHQALEELRAAGQTIVWVYGTVADEPTIRGGWILDEHRTAERENGTSAHAPSESEEASRLAHIACPSEARGRSSGSTASQAVRPEPHRRPGRGL
ncbi:MAG: hypothetical protein ACLPY3_24410 [Solirubrobacteraceae bacterium]